MGETRKVFGRWSSYDEFARDWAEYDYACPLSEHDDEALERMRAILAEREAPHA